MDDATIVETLGFGRTELGAPPIYCLDEILPRAFVHVVESEKSADALASIGATATTNPMGAGKWRPAHTEQLVETRPTLAIVWADCDSQGRAHAATVAGSLREGGLDVRCVELDRDREDGFDVADMLAEERRNGTDDDLRGWVEEIVENADREPPAGWLEAAAAPLDETEREPTDAEICEPSAPVALWLDEFIAARSSLPAALLGDETENLLPTTGLMILFGRGGQGKTTLVVELALHLASGVDWLGFAVSRALRVLFIENEGPREMFRRKLEAKRDAWPHPIEGGIAFWTLDWGAFTFADDERAARLRAFIRDNGIDVVIGDPLDSLGVDGVGSPEDTRRFMSLMADVGLFRDVAFVLLHHPRKLPPGGKETSELDEISGAWGGKPDSMLRLAKLDGDRSRLSFPKMRWSRRAKRPALILAFDPETESLTVAYEEQAVEEERDYRAEIVELLSDGEPRTAEQIAKRIGVGVKKVRDALRVGPDVFVMATGEDARALGGHPNSHL